MPPLVKIRSERDQMSAIERRIADFIVDNAHLLRDYSSQQLASALGISQSSVVKFSQKLGFKGYPDLKYSVGEAPAHGGMAEVPRPAEATPDNPHEALAESLWRGKAAAEQETRLINPQAGIDAVVAAPLAASLSTAAAGDVLLVFCEHGKQPGLTQLGRELQDHDGTLVSVTRHTANPLRAHADLSPLVSAHDERTYVEPLLYRAALQHLLDGLLVLLCERDAVRRQRYDANLECLRQALAP